MLHQYSVGATAGVTGMGGSTEARIAWIVAPHAARLVGLLVLQQLRYYQANVN